MVGVVGRRGVVWWWSGSGVGVVVVMVGYGIRGVGVVG